MNRDQCTIHPDDWRLSAVYAVKGRFGEGKCADEPAAMVVGVEEDLFRSEAVPLAAALGSGAGDRVGVVTSAAEVGRGDP
jgi:hypothetical protein